MARKPRVVPFVPFPRDGDLDGLVQDGTIWERPKGAYLRFVDTGEIWSERGQVDRGRVEIVRPDGSVWDFTPSWYEGESTLGSMLGTLGDDLPLVFESTGMLPRGFLGPTLADESRFDGEFDNVAPLSDATAMGREGVLLLTENDEKIRSLLSPDAVRRGIIKQETQDRLAAFVRLSDASRSSINGSALLMRQRLFDVMHERLYGTPMKQRGALPEYERLLPFGLELVTVVRDGSKDSFETLRSRLAQARKTAVMSNRPVEEVLGPVDEDTVQFVRALTQTMPVTTWHEHHIKELVEAYVSRDFDKAYYHIEWLDNNTDREKQQQYDWLNQLQYMADIGSNSDKREELDRIFRQGAQFKDYDYYMGYAFERTSNDIAEEAVRIRSDMAALDTDRRIEFADSSHTIPSDSRLVDRAGDHSGKYQDFDLITQVLRDIEIAELEIDRLNREEEPQVAGEVRGRLAELKAELKQVTKPIDIELEFSDEVLNEMGGAGILGYIPGGAENPELLRKIRKAADSLSPEFRPKKILIGFPKKKDGSISPNSAGSYNGSNGVLTIAPRMLGLSDHLVVDKQRQTIRRFGPDDGADGVELPLGMANTPELQELFDISKKYGLDTISSKSLETVAVHEAVHRIDYLLTSDFFFRRQLNNSYELEEALQQLMALRRDPSRTIAQVQAMQLREAELKREQVNLSSLEITGRYITNTNSPIRRLSQKWIDENQGWLEEYARNYEYDPRGADQGYLLSIFGQTPGYDYINEKFGVPLKDRAGLDLSSEVGRNVIRTERMEVLAEVLSSQILKNRRIPAGTSEAGSNLPEELDRLATQIIPEELKFILSERGWSEDEIPPLTAMPARRSLKLSESTPWDREDLLSTERRSMVPKLSIDPATTLEMLSDAERDDRDHRILGELAQAQIDEPKLFRNGKLVDKLWAPFSPPPHIAGSGLRDELGEAQSWREVAQILRGKRVVVFDTETAGRMDPDEVDDDRIVQLGGVVYENGMIVDRFSMYVNVDFDELSEWSQTNLVDAEGKAMSREFLDRQPTMSEVFEEFMQFANGETDGSDVVFMAHNAAFDLKRMELERQRHNPDGVPSFDLDEVTYFDTMGLGNIVKRSGVEGAPGSASLKKLQEFFGLEDFSWHTADADSEMTGQVLWRLLDYMDENDVSLDGLDPVAGLERQREEFAAYEAEIPEFLRQKERLAELRGLSDQLRSDRDDAVDAMIGIGAEGLDGGEESTDIPGGGVVETDDGGFWVPGPPPVGFNEDGKEQWGRGVELLRERPDLFKTQVIADDGLPVPKDEKPGLADIGSVFDVLPEDDAVAAMTIRREIEQAWQAEITRAIALNKIDIGNPEEVWGSDTDERSEANQRYGAAARADRGMWETLPQGLLHVTTGLSGLQDGGFKTRAQLRDESGEAPAGLGGGTSKAISFTTDPLVADSIVRGIHEMHEVVRDDTGPAAVERMKSEIAAWDTSMPEDVREKLLSAAPATMKERGEFYKDYSYWRQFNVPNRPDPLFWSPNYQAYADLDPNEVGVVTVNPSRAGTRGWQVEGMGEWRTIPEAVEIVQSEARPTIVDDMTATLDELDTVRSSAPDFGLPPGPDSPNKKNSLLSDPAATLDEID